MLNNYIIPAVQVFGMVLPFVLGLCGGYFGYWLLFQRFVPSFGDNYDGFSKALSICVVLGVLVSATATIQSFLKGDGLLFVTFGFGLVGYLMAHRKYLMKSKELWLRYRNLTTQSRGPP